MSSYEIDSITIKIKDKLSEEPDIIMIYINYKWSLTGAVYPKYIKLMEMLNDFILRNFRKDK